MKKKIIKTILVSTLAVHLVTQPLCVFGCDINITRTIYDLGKGDKFVWRYKEINGKMYKRLYNTSTGKYVGEWTPV